MTYFFIPGRIFNLSKAELNITLKAHLNSEFIIKVVENRYLLVSTDADYIAMKRIYNRLGGFISFGKIIDNRETFLEQFDSSEKQVRFGISLYTDIKSEWNFSKVKKLAKSIKTRFKEIGVGSRFIMPKDKTLNTAQITKNNILETGFELVILQDNEQYLYGETLGVQDIEAFAQREYERPSVDKQMGVLPAKLARILVNLTGQTVGAKIWDPFCGSGTILMEGLMLGYNMLGSDIDRDAIRYSEDNIKWMGDEKMVGDVNFSVFPLNILRPDSKTLRELKNSEVNAVACEPYMGPPQHRPMGVNTAKELLSDVSKLYSNLFYILNHMKLTEFTAIIVLPSYKTHEGWLTTSLNQIVGKKWKIENSKYGKDLHWSRANSIIRREIFILSKKSR